MLLLISKTERCLEHRLDGTKNQNWTFFEMKVDGPMGQHWTVQQTLCRRSNSTPLYHIGAIWIKFDRFFIRVKDYDAIFLSFLFIEVSILSRD